MARAVAETSSAPTADAASRAAALLPALRERAERTEDQRCVPAESVADLRAADLIQLHQPRRFGGPGGCLADAVRVSRSLASACLSSAWVQGVFSGHLMFLAHLPVEAQEEVYGRPDAVVSAVLKAGKATVERDGEGFRLSEVEGRFCSGVDHCTWLLLGAEAEGERWFFLLPREDVEIVDDWQTIAMRGTGSKSIRVRDAYVPLGRAASYASMLDATSPGTAALDEPFYRLPVDVITPYSLVGNSIGGAYAALDELAVALGRKVGGPAAPQAGVMARLGAMAATLDAAYATVLGDAERIDLEGDRGTVSPVEKARLSRNRAYAAQTSRRVANDAFELSGGSALYHHTAVQRIWRDVNGASNHIGVTWDPAMTASGRLLIEEASL